jgi:hypothetical protein
MYGYQLMSMLAEDRRTDMLRDAERARQADEAHQHAVAYQQAQNPEQPRSRRSLFGRLAWWRRRATHLAAS